MNDFRINHVLLCQKYTNTYADRDAEIRKWIYALIIYSSMDGINIWFNRSFTYCQLLTKVTLYASILCLMRCSLIFEAVFQSLHTWFKQFSLEEPSNTVGENIALLMLQLWPVLSAYRTWTSLQLRKLHISYNFSPSYMWKSSESPSTWCYIKSALNSSVVEY